MNNTGKTIAKNASFLMGSQVVTWSLAILLMMFLPRYLGAASIGQLHLANSIWAIIAIFVTFGMDIMMTKEVARSHDKFSELAGTSLVIRLVFYIIGILFLTIYLQWANYSDQAVLVIVIIGVSSLISQIGTVFKTSLVGNERMEYIAYADIVGKLFRTVVTLTVIFMGFGILAVALVVIGTSIVSVLMQVFAARKLHPIKLSFRWDIVKWMLKASAPFFFVAVFRAIYVQVDVIIISLLVNEEVIGWYSAADSLFSTFLFIPTIFLTAAFPALARLFEEKSDELGSLMRKSFDMLMLLSIPIGLGMFVLGTEIVVLIFGPDFENSGAVLSVMGIVLIFTYLNILIGRFLIATNRQNKWTIVMAIAVLLSFPLDFILVPWCQETFGNGAIGGALAFVVTESGMLLIGIYLLPKGSLGWSNVWVTSRVLLAGIIMVVVVWQFKDFFIAIPIFFGIITFAGFSWLFGVLPKELFTMFHHVGKKILAKFRRKEVPVN